MHMHMYMCMHMYMYWSRICEFSTRGSLFEASRWLSAIDSLGSCVLFSSLRLCVGLEVDYCHQDNTHVFALAQ